MSFTAFGLVPGSSKYGALTCASQVFELKTSGGEYEAALLAPRCTATTTIPENGNHGFYPSPHQATVDQVSMPLGGRSGVLQRVLGLLDRSYVCCDE